MVWYGKAIPILMKINLPRSRAIGTSTAGRNEDATLIDEYRTHLVPKVDTEDRMDSGSLVEETEHTDEEVEAVIKDTESAKQSQFTGESEISSNGFPDHTNCKAPQIK